jgi:predicted ATPase/class 3 adenylate cyclase
MAALPQWSWNDVGMSELLPTGVVTLLLSDIEGSTHLWDTCPDEMSAAVEHLDRALAAAIAAHGGVQPMEQGEGDSFVVAFTRAADAVACALDLQRTPLAPIRMRIGVHTGQVQLRNESNYVGSTINEAARLRDLAYGGQTVISAATKEMVDDRLPTDAWLVDKGSHLVKGVTRPLKVLQLCHPDVRNEFPPLRGTSAVGAHNLPTQTSSFVGRGEQIKDVRELLTANRVVTLTGAGGAGKTRLALQVAAALVDDYQSGVWFVDLSPVTDSDNVPVAAAHALGLLDQLGPSPLDTVARFIGDKRLLLILDNCEHVIDASANAAAVLLAACAGLSLLATSREPLGVSGEVAWRIPSLAIADEAVELFADRAERARPDFRLGEDTTATVTEICGRLDGMPLAIELAAARIRALSLAELSSSLNDRFQLLTGGGRTLMPRQQTLRASVDWSHELLAEDERVLFRRLAVFRGGFDLDAIHAVAANDGAQRHFVLDQITLLVDKSLVVAKEVFDHTRFHMLETMRQYAGEKLTESGEETEIRRRHLDHYMAMVDQLHSDARAGHGQLFERAVVEMGNVRSAFTWIVEQDADAAMLIRAAQGAVWLADMQLADRLAVAAIRAGRGVDASFVRVHALSWLSRGDEADAVMAEMNPSELTDNDYARFVMLRASNRLWALGDPEGAKSFIDEMLAAAPSRDRGGIDAFLSVYWFAMGKPAESAQSAKSVAVDGLPTVVGAEVAWAMTGASADAGRITDALAAAEKGYSVALRSFDAPQMRLIIADAHVGALMLAGRLTDACQIAARMREQAAELSGVAQLLSTAVAGRAALGAGKLHDACSQLGSVADALSSAGESNGWAYRYQVPRTIALALLGYTAEASDALAEVERLRHASWRFLDYERTLAAAWVAAAEGAVDQAVAMTLSAAETARANGQFGAELSCLQTATQFGCRSAAPRLRELEAIAEGRRAGLAARFASALLADRAGDLATVSEDLEEMGDLIAAMDASAHAAIAYSHDDEAAESGGCADRAALLTERCGGATTPATRQLAELAHRDESGKWPHRI